MNLTFTPSAWEDYQWFQQHDRKLLKRINQLIQEVLRTPFEGGRGKTSFCPRRWVPRAPQQWDADRAASPSRRSLFLETSAFLENAASFKLPIHEPTDGSLAIGFDADQVPRQVRRCFVMRKRLSMKEFGDALLPRRRINRIQARG